MENKDVLPNIIYAEVPVKSSDISLFEKSASIITTTNIEKLLSSQEKIFSTAHYLRIEGFQVLQIGEISISIAGKPALYKKVFKTDILPTEVPVIKGGHKETTSTFFDSPDTDILGLVPTNKSNLKNIIPEGLALTTPVQYLSNNTNNIAISHLPPTKTYWHLKVPDDVSSGMNSSSAHRAGFTGRGIRIVMTDTGFWKHPYFTKRAYHINPTVLGPGTENPLHDEVGHGTAECANIFAVAPDVEFTMVKQQLGTNITPSAIGAIKSAIAIKPDVITCSWGTRTYPTPLTAAERVLSAEIANAVRHEIIVVFSAGNGHYGFPGEHPDVISVGGVYMDKEGGLQATPYASAFKSRIFADRNCPDVCGLVGLPPKAAYIMLPLEPGCSIDVELSGGNHPNNDETGNDDGWACISGTSAAAPQIAGICALMKQANPRITPVQAKQIIQDSARDVTEGQSGADGPSAGPGPDLATGSGLADAFQAVLASLKRGELR
jgi:serine protease AprX